MLTDMERSSYLAMVEKNLKSTVLKIILKIKEALNLRTKYESLSKICVVRNLIRP